MRTGPRFDLTFPPYDASGIFPVSGEEKYAVRALERPCALTPVEATGNPIVKNATTMTIAREMLRTLLLMVSSRH